MAYAEYEFPNSPMWMKTAVEGLAAVVIRLVWWLTNDKDEGDII
jgi:hypothetical protein